MRPMLLVAVNVFRESVRDKVLYNLVLFAVLMIGASYLIGQITAGQDLKIIKDLGLAATSVFGLFIAIFIGIGLVSKEVEKRSIYALLAKPITRTQIVLGKYLGLVATLAVNLAVMTAALYAVLAFMAWMAGAGTSAWDRPAVDPLLLQSVALTFVELAVITAIAVFFSTFSTPILSAAFTFALFVAGRFSADLRNFNVVTEAPVAKALTSGLYWLLPNLGPFDIRTQVVHGQGVPAGQLLLTAGSGLLYAAALLVAATFIFSRRDFK